MSDLDLVELSAFLDGELEPVRAREIEALLAADPGVRSAFERLRQAHERLESVAEAASFLPAISLPEAAPRPVRAWLALPLLFILIAWVAGKLTPAMTTALVVNGASLVLLIACLAPFALREVRAGANSLYLTTGDPVR